MVLLQIDADGIRAVPLERDAPGAVDVKAVAHRLALEGVEVEAANVRVLGPRGLMKSAKPALCPILQCGGHLAAAAGIPKIGETFVAEAFDHRKVKHGLTYSVNPGFTADKPTAAPDPPDIGYDVSGGVRDLARPIAIDPRILAARPAVRGTRLAVEFIVGLLGEGWAETDILKNYPGLTHEDIAACLRYASQTMFPFCS